MLSNILRMLKRLKAAIAVFVFEQLDPIFLCVAAVNARRTNLKDYVMTFYLKPLQVYVAIKVRFPPYFKNSTVKLDHLKHKLEALK